MKNHTTTFSSTVLNRTSVDTNVSRSMLGKHGIQPEAGGVRSSSAATAVVIGGGLGGLSAAIHLRLAGCDVTLFEANDRVGGRASRIERDGFSFDTGPSLLNYPWVFRELFAAAGRNFDDYVTLLPVDPSVGFQWADGTHLMLSSNLQRLLEESERIEPGSRPAMLAFLRDAERKYRIAFDKLVTRNADGPVAWAANVGLTELLRLGLWRSLDGELRRFFHSRYLREAFGSYGMYLGGSPFDLPGIFSMLPYGELSYGLWLPKGGIYALVEGMERLAIELGVKIRTGSRVRRVVCQGRMARGVELEDGSIHDASAVISNVDVPTTLSDLIEPDVRTRRMEREVAGTRMTPGVLTFYWGVRGQVAGLGHHTIFLPNDYRTAFDDLIRKGCIPDGLPFYVAVPSATDSDMAPPGDSSLFVLVPTPLISQLGTIDWETTVKDVRRRVLERLRTQGVVLDEECIVVEEVLTPEEWRQRFGLYDGSAFGASHSLRQIGPFRSPNHSRDIEGLYFVGAGTTPGTGMPMVVLGGKMTAERVLEKIGAEAT